MAAAAEEIKCAWARVKGCNRGVHALFSPRYEPASRCYHPALARLGRAAMALSKLSGDEQGIIFGQLCNPFEPSLAVYFSSANRELRLFLTPALQVRCRRRLEG